MRRLASHLAAPFLLLATQAQAVVPLGPGQVATRYAEQRWPGSTRGPDGASLPQTVTDRGGYWVVTYQRNARQLGGGTPVITIRRGDLRVLRAYLSR